MASRLYTEYADGGCLCRLGGVVCCWDGFGNVYGGASCLLDESADDDECIVVNVGDDPAPPVDECIDESVNLRTGAIPDGYNEEVGDVVAMCAPGDCAGFNCCWGERGDALELTIEGKDPWVVGGDGPVAWNTLVEVINSATEGKGVICGFGVILTNKCKCCYCCYCCCCCCDWFSLEGCGFFWLNS